MRPVYGLFYVMRQGRLRSKNRGGSLRSNNRLRRRKKQRSAGWQRLGRRNGSRLYVISKMNSGVWIEKHGMDLLCKRLYIIRHLPRRGRRGRLRTRRTTGYERSRRSRRGRCGERSSYYVTKKMSSAGSTDMPRMRLAYRLFHVIRQEGLKSKKSVGSRTLERVNGSERCVVNKIEEVG
jgi:hypothetical protein